FQDLPMLPLINALCFKFLSFSQHAFYKTFFLFGKRNRFFYVMRLVEILEPLMSRFSRYAIPHYALGSQREYLASTLLRSLTFNDIEFEPVVKVRGDELPVSDGAILISGHFYLNFVFFRTLFDAGRETTVFLHM